MRTLLLRMVRIAMVGWMATVLAGCGGGATTGGAIDDPPTDPAPVTSVAVLSWTAPTTYDDGSPLVVAGYKVYYGTVPGDYAFSVTVGDTRSASIDGLESGVWYFSVTAVDEAGIESDFASPVSKII